MKKITTIVSICILSFFSGFVVTVVSHIGRVISEDRIAATVVAHCKTSGYKPACYDREIPKDTQSFSMEQSFGVTRRVQEIDTTYQYCHVLGHELAARETKKDPAKWKDVITRCPSGMCSNGCIHGAFQERFRTDTVPDDQLESIKSELLNVCEKRGSWMPTGMEQASCYHALGHLLMYITNARIEKALAFCDDLTTDFRSVCYDGSFMQIFQPLEPEDFALIKGKELTVESVTPFCLRFNGKMLGSCWSESWPLFREKFQIPEGLMSHCGFLPPDLQDRCFRALSYVMTVQMGFSEEKLEPYCSHLMPPFAARCFAMAASRFIETDWKNIDKALAWCKRVSSFDPDGECYLELSKTASFTVPRGSAEQKKICDGLPRNIQAECGRRP
ncbi:hypothetical protein HY947_00350 [Candidatus Gottesmanbacteria bacterium]|nr:hypothetical protein [Candidatus Gottesmanbacteria bacterium]